MTGTPRIDRVVTSGTFSLDGGTWDVDNNVWIIGDDDDVVVVDAAHDAEAIQEAVAGRRVTAIICTHAHDDHINAAAALASATTAPVKLHPADDELWQRVYPGTTYQPLTDGEEIDVAGLTLKVLHTPGHAPGAVCLHIPELSALFSGDTLFQGGPGATGRSFSSFPTIIDSITDHLLTLPPDTVVHPGHGDTTTIGAEAPHRQEWIDRGH
ncbi:putative hydrolase in cluster with formaldehyde/S-nitrosomycothiol reductase MscR [Actinokineospora spheciospongiae]|uniref:Putative hydrolase in cluster with formaldehyde/S-nitrosomycothiol reductase MscR n=1 Tax=Actinokineospora spheciospongiae TaxID=909613 RepID=W7IP43_9PSEU|nr:MBL fold metallo-hydrolase [Actinokineospora spheciospongiae]EWC58336.1 putative hydrolase in cluster with formaldehyde/S-nitrosomycothiol reductase MscR [Actinokineospora spheciospongiae]PWW62001.1 glyoxylase-like metal-dependent hydrolase (beta-lactamase superfamily II) [Actinokineospora spheciospongiae]